VLVAADANVLLSVVLGHAASRAVQEGGVELATTLATLREVREHLAEVAETYRTRTGILEARLEALAVKAYGPRKYRAQLREAGRRIGDRDEDDVHLVALALRLRIPIWTNDRHFDKIGLETLSTARLLARLGIRGR
jgi:predicted nucleic acid-binding protein